MPRSLEILKLLFFPSVVLCTAHVQAFCATVHLVHLNHEPILVQDVPSTCTTHESFSPITVASSIVFILGHVKTCPLTNETLIPFSSSAYMERIFFFNLGTYSTSFIFKDFQESIMYEDSTLVRGASRLSRLDSLVD